MCVILELKPGVMPVFEAFQNAVWNNPHGYGIILKDNGRMEVRKGLTAEDKANPEEIYKILYDNKDVERIVHLRYRTAGEVNEDNLHPFLVHKVGKTETWFAHNGTFNRFTSSRWVNGQRIEDVESDTASFVKQVLQPLFTNFRLTSGYVDLENPFLKEVIGKYWEGASRGILVNAFQENLKIGTWENIKGVDGLTFYSSNDSYYKDVIRGPIFEKRKREEEALRKSTSVATIYPPKVVPLNSDRFDSTYKLSKELEEMWSDTDLYTVEGLSTISALSLDEIREIVKKDQEGAVTLISMLSQYLRESVIALDTLAEEMQNV